MKRYDKLKIISGEVTSYVWLDSNTSVSLVYDYENEEIETRDINLEELEKIIENTEKHNLENTNEIIKKQKDEISDLKYKLRKKDDEISNLKETIKIVGYEKNTEAKR